MKVQPWLPYTAALSRLITRYISPITVRCCAALLLCMVIPRAGQAQTFTTLANFNGSNGSSPLFAALVQGTDGNLYGTTSAGGAPKQGREVSITPPRTPTPPYTLSTT